MTKKIKVLSRKPIYAKGGVYGPILTPYSETIENIFAMLRDRVKVVEVLEDGREVELTFANYKKVNDGKEEKALAEAKKALAEAEERRKAEEAEARRKEAEEAKRKAEQEAARRKAEADAAKRRADADAARRKAEQEAANKKKELKGDGVDETKEEEKKY